MAHNVKVRLANPERDLRAQSCRYDCNGAPPPLNGSQWLAVKQQAFRVARPDERPRRRACGAPRYPPTAGSRFVASARTSRPWITLVAPRGVHRTGAGPMCQAPCPRSPLDRFSAWCSTPRCLATVRAWLRCRLGVEPCGLARVGFCWSAGSRSRRPHLPQQNVYDPISSAEEIEGTRKRCALIVLRDLGRQEVDEGTNLGREILAAWIDGMQRVAEP